MSAEEMNKYRFSSMDEPTDEMLAQLMREAAEAARHKGHEAQERFFEYLKQEVDDAKSRRQCAS